jgi:hypothetical protein
MGFPLVENKRQESCTLCRKIVKYAVICFTFLAASFQGRSANLLVNGDFEQGNSGFTSDFIYSPGDLKTSGTYDVLVDPQVANPFEATFGDHTTGHGLMLALNVADQQNTILWRETVEVIPHHPYVFSGWVANRGCSSNLIYDAEVLVNGERIGGFSLYPPNGGWKQFFGGWNSKEATSAEVEVRVATIGPCVGMALDDLSLEEASADPCMVGYHVPSGWLLEGDLWPVFQDETQPGTGTVSHFAGGDGLLRFLDWVTLYDMSRGYRIPLTDCEAIVADCAPPETKGDGIIDVADVFEGFRKSVGLAPRRSQVEAHFQGFVRTSQRLIASRWFSRQRGSRMFMRCSLRQPRCSMP